MSYLHHLPASVGPRGRVWIKAKSTLVERRRNEGSRPPPPPDGAHLEATVARVPTAHTLHMLVAPSSSSPSPSVGYDSP